MNTFFDKSDKGLSNCGSIYAWKSYPLAVPIAIFIRMSQVRGLTGPTTPCNHCSKLPLSTYSYTSILSLQDQQIRHTLEWLINQSEIGWRSRRAPLGAFCTVANKTNQIFMPDFSYSFNFHLEFSLCLSPTRSWLEIGYTHSYRSSKGGHGHQFFLFSFFISLCSLVIQPCHKGWYV